MQINWQMQQQQHYHSLIAPILVFEAHKVISFQDIKIITNGKRERENFMEASSNLCSTNSLMIALHVHENDPNLCIVKMTLKNIYKTYTV